MMLKKTIYLTSIITFTFLCFGFASQLNPDELNSYKCLIQLKKYKGEGAYVIISLMNPEGEYEKTIYVQGEDENWYSELYSWWGFHGKIRSDKIDGITGPTVSRGGRTIQILNIPKNKINVGYSLRFETAVEDQEYEEEELKLELTTKNLESQIKGGRFIKYVRMMPQN